MTQPKNSTETAYHIICDMEEPLLAVKNFARMIAGFAETLEDGDAGAVQATAWHIIDLAKTVENNRGKALHLLYPYGADKAA